MKLCGLKSRVTAEGIGVEHDLDRRLAHLLHDPDADFDTVQSCDEREGQDVGRAPDQETRPQIGERLRAEGVILHQLPVRVVPRLKLAPSTTYHKE